MTEIRTENYELEIPNNWKQIEFDKNEYELALTNQNNENEFYFNLKKCFTKNNFQFGSFKINILDEKKNKESSLKSCGNIDAKNRIGLEEFVKILESIKPIIG